VTQRGSHGPERRGRDPRPLSSRQERIGTQRFGNGINRQAAGQNGPLDNWPTTGPPTATCKPRRSGWRWWCGFRGYVRAPLAKKRWRRDFDNIRGQQFFKGLTAFKGQPPPRTASRQRASTQFQSNAGALDVGTICYSWPVPGAGNRAALRRKSRQPVAQINGSRRQGASLRPFSADHVLGQTRAATSASSPQQPCCPPAAQLSCPI